MGWLFKFDMTKRSDMIADRIRVWDTRRFEKDKNKNTYIVTTCLKHCYRGNAFRGVLWTVRESRTYGSISNALIESHLWIGCDILQYDNKDKCWGYKDLEESSGPNYLSCPLSYLAMGPEPIEGYGVEWRKDVRQYHAERKSTFKPKIGDFIILKTGWIHSRYIFKITSIKGLRGVNGKRSYKIPRRSLLRKVTREELDRAKKEYPQWAKEKFGIDDVDSSKVTDEAIFVVNDFLFPEVQKN